MQDVIDTDNPNLTLCEAVQIALDMNARGALAPDKRTRLEIHVAGCEECRAYRSTMTDTDAALRGLLEREVGPGTPADSEKFVARARRRERFDWLFLPIIFVITLAGLFACDLLLNGRIEDPDIVLIISALGLLPGIVVQVFRRRTRRRLLAGDDVVAMHRRLLEDSLRVHTRARYVWLLVILVPLLPLVAGSMSDDRFGQGAAAVSIVSGLVVLMDGQRRIADAHRQLARMR